MNSLVDFLLNVHITPNSAIKAQCADSQGKKGCAFSGEFRVIFQYTGISTIYKKSEGHFIKQWSLDEKGQCCQAPADLKTEFENMDPWSKTVHQILERWHINRKYQIKCTRRVYFEPHTISVCFEVTYHIRSYSLSQY